MEADVYTDGHDVVAASILWRTRGEQGWNDVPMRALGNDRWTGRFEIEELTAYEYTVEGWIDGFETWRQELSQEGRRGAGRQQRADRRGSRAARGRRPRGRPNACETACWRRRTRWRTSGSRRVLPLRWRRNWRDNASAATGRGEATRYDRILTVLVERERARFGAWYEMFPARLDRSGTQRDVR